MDMKSLFQETYSQLGQIWNNIRRKPMASLTSLPEELFDDIIELVLLAERESPRNNETAAQNLEARKRRRTNDTSSWDYGPSNVLFETDPPVPAANALLLVNRHFYKQTKQALSRLFPDGVNYKLDALFVNETEIWPTWLSIPAISDKVNTVDVTFRIFGRRPKGCRTAFRPGDGSPPQFVWLFYYLMEDFIRHGPSYSTRQLNISVQNINLNFVSGELELEPEDTKEQREKWWSRQRVYGWDSDEDDETDEPLLAADGPLRMHPAWLAKDVSSNIVALTSMSYHSASYGGILHNHIGRISISCNSSQLQNIELGNILASLDDKPEPGSEWYTTTTFGHIGGDCRLLTFWNWKYGAVQRRKKLGLPVGEDVAWPTLDELRGWREARDEYRYGNGASSILLECRNCLCHERELEIMLEKEEQA